MKRRARSLSKVIMVHMTDEEKYLLQAVATEMGVSMNGFVRAAISQVIGQMLDTGLPELRGWMLRDIIEQDLPRPPDCDCYGPNNIPERRPEVGLGADCPKCGRHWPWNQTQLEIPPYADQHQ